jgi:hypothetical protein
MYKITVVPAGTTQPAHITSGYKAACSAGDSAGNSCSAICCAPLTPSKHIKAGTLRTTRNIWFRIFIAANLLRLFEKTKPSTPVLTEE